MPASPKSTTTTPASSPASASATGQKNGKASFSEEEILTQWGHYSNFAQLMTEAGSGKKRRQLGGICGLFSHKVTITEKLDGSNLGMWVRHNPAIDKKDNPDSWEVLLLQGRNQPIWRKKGFDEFAERRTKLENQNKNNKNASKNANVNNKNNNNGNDDDKKDANNKKKLIASLYDDLEFMSTCLPQYGLAKNLGKLVYKMREFCIGVANALDLDEIEIFGEAFRAKKIFTEGNQKVERFAALASWHPFGYKDPRNDWQLSRLTSQTHRLFSRFVILPAVASKTGNGNSAPQTHNEVIDYLMAAQDHSVFPPPLMRVTMAKKNKTNNNNDDSDSRDLVLTENVVLLDAISALLPTMINPPERAFEGVFIVSETSEFGCKFKCGSHDEQKRLPTLSDIGIIEDEAELAKLVAEQQQCLAKNPNYFNSAGGVINYDLEMMKRIKIIFEIMCKIFSMKTEIPDDLVKGGGVGEVASPGVASADENWNKVVKTMNSDIQTACDREFGKRLSVAHFEVGSAERQAVIDEVTQLVIKEVIEVYEESEKLKMPYTKEQLSKRAANMVKLSVEKVPFQPLGKQK